MLISFDENAGCVDEVIIDRTWLLDVHVISIVNEDAAADDDDGDDDDDKAE